jgi:hypothetical protein
MKALEKYVKAQSGWGEIFGEPKIEFPLTEAQIQKLASGLDAQLSPENLTCDGELSATEVNKRFRYYSQVARELQDYAQSMEYSIPTFYEI